MLINNNEETENNIIKSTQRTSDIKEKEEKKYSYEINSNSDDSKMKYSRVYFNIEQDTVNFIKNKFSLSSSDKIFLIITEKLNNDSYLATVDYIHEYILENGTKLDINSIEEDIYIDVYVPIDDLDLAKFELAKQFAEQGYDIYNKNSSFYTDFCTPANINGNDISLKDRMKDIYPHNITLCKDNCIYNGINLEEQRVICSCNINSNKNIEDNNESIEDEGNFESYFLDNINYKIFKCYKLFFNWENLKNSNAFYIILIIFLILFMFNLFFICHSIDRLKIYMAREMFAITIKTNETIPEKIEEIPELDINKNANPQKKKEKPFKSSKRAKDRSKSNKNVFVSGLNKKFSDKEIIDKDSYKMRNRNTGIYEGFETRKGSDEKFALETKEEIKKEEIIKEVKTKKEEDINELPFSKAVQVDNRNICLIFYSFIIEKLELISILCNETNIKSMYFSEYILALLINFFFNALLYSDEVVSNKYHNNGELDFIVCLILSILSNIVTSIFCYYLKYTRGIEEKIKIILEIKYKMHCYRNIKRLLSYLRIKFICFFFAQLIIMAICIYYIVIFCIKYSCSQISLLVNYCYSFVESIITSFVITFIILITRKIGLCCPNKELYNTSKYINSKF